MPSLSEDTDAVIVTHFGPNRHMAIATLATVKSQVFCLIEDRLNSPTRCLMPRLRRLVSSDAKRGALTITWCGAFLGRDESVQIRCFEVRPKLNLTRS